MGDLLGFSDQRAYLAYLVFFINGLALFALGFSAWLESRRPGESVFVRSLWLLAAYALVVALASWSEMALIIQGLASPQFVSVALFALKMASIAIGSLFLFRFGAKVSSAIWPMTGPWLRWLPVILMLVWGLVLFQTRSAESVAAWLDGAETATRRVLYFPALLLSGLALFHYRPSASAPGLACRMSAASAGAALALGFKSIVSGLVAVDPPAASAIALGGDLQQTALVLIVGPLRTVSTLLMAYFMMRLLACVESERQCQLDLAVQQRLQAQQAALEAKLLSEEAIEEWNNRLDFVANAMASAIREPGRVQDALSRTLSEMLVWTGFEAGQVLLKPRSEGNCVLVAQRGMPRRKTRDRCWVEASEALARVPDSASVVSLPATSGPDDSLHEWLGFRTLCAIPIKHGNHTFGRVLLCSARAVPVGSSDLTLLGSLGRQIGVAVEHARVHEHITSAATREERARLSREMHDTVGQNLMSLHMKVAALEDLATDGDLPDAVTQLHEVVELCSRACDDVREAIMDLRFAACSYGGLLSELQDYATRLTQHSGISVAVRTERCEGLTLSHVVEVQLLGIIQEALSNVRRHSGATDVSLGLTCEQGTVVLSIVDNGRGFDAASVHQDGPYHIGLRTMTDRAESVGGSLQVISSPGAGTRLVVRVPAIVLGGL